MTDVSFSSGHSDGRRVERMPFVLGVMADLSGRPAEPLGPITGRDFLEIDVDNVDARLRDARPRVAFRVPNAVVGEGELEVDLTFRGRESFSPAYVASNIDVFAKLCAARARLAAMEPPPGTEAQPRALLAEALDDPALARALVAGPAAAETAAVPPEAAEHVSDLNRLLARPLGSGVDSQVSAAVDGFLRQAVAETTPISDEALLTVHRLLQRIDAALAGLLNLVLHHEAYQTLESTWRGLSHVIENVETGENVKLRVLSVSKAELAEMFETAAEPGESPLAAKLRDKTCGCLVGDFYFDHSPADMALLTGLGQVAEDLGIPFIAGAAPSLLGLDSWRALHPTTATLEIFEQEAYADWRQLFDSPVGNCLFLTMPRVLARLPYGRRTNPTEGLEFEEDAAAGDPTKFTWSNAAWAMAAAVGRAVSAAGSETRLAAGSQDCQVRGLPCYAFTTRDGDQELMCPTETPMTAEFGALLSKAGLAPLLHVKNTDRATFVHMPALER